MSALLPDAEMLIRFTSAMFKHADRKGVVSLRAFPDNRSGDSKVIFIEGISIGDPQFLDVLFERTRQAAQWPDPAVFCPPVMTFKDGKNAKADNVLEGVVLSVDCDRTPRAAYSVLSKLLGEPTIVVASGGEWINPETGQAEPKVHQHWRLNRPAATAAEHAQLREARDLAVKLVGGDPSGVPLVHPLRWPGSWHRKTKPRMAAIVFESENEIDLIHVLTILREATGSKNEDVKFSRESELEAADPHDVVEALHNIPNENLDWCNWNNIGLAIYGATGGRDEGRDAFAQWSARAAKNNPQVTEERWRHYSTSPPDRIGFGTLVYLTRQHSPNWKPAGSKSDSSLQFRALSKQEFIGGFVPPNYLLDGILQRKFVYSLTAQTGHGKTAVALLVARLVGGGDPKAALGRHPAEKGQVVYFEGENPDDLRMRVIGDDPLCNDENARIWFIPGTFSIEAMREKIDAEMHRLGGVDLVIVDTSAAYFNGKDELSNTEMGAHAVIADAHDVAWRVVCAGALPSDQACHRRVAALATRRWSLPGRGGRQPDALEARGRSA